MYVGMHLPDRCIIYIGMVEGFSKLLGFLMFCIFPYETLLRVC